MGFAEKWSRMFKNKTANDEFVVNADAEDFPAECKDAFLRLIQERDQINLHEPAHRRQNAEKYLKKTNAINRVLDEYNAWRELQSVEGVEGFDSSESLQGT